MHRVDVEKFDSVEERYFRPSTMAVKEKQTETATDDIEWNVENEIQLFFAMNGHKPVGINKHFHMVCIWEKFRNATHKDVSPKLIWDHLESMYDLMALDDMEDLPFPSQEVEFALPDQEFLACLKARKRDDAELKGNKELDKKKDDLKKYMKETEVKKDKLRDIKELKKEHKSSKGRSKGKDEPEESASNGKKERKDSDSGRESLKRGPKRPTRQSVDSSAKASSSPRDTPPPKRRRI